MVRHVGTSRCQRMPEGTRGRTQRRQDRRFNDRSKRAPRLCPLGADTWIEGCSDFVPMLCLPDTVDPRGKARR